MQATYDTWNDKDGFKWDYAAAYDWEFRVHLEEHFINCNKSDAEQSEQSASSGISSETDEKTSEKGQNLNAAEKKKEERA
jgi:hypothetical protein